MPGEMEKMMLNQVENVTICLSTINREISSTFISSENINGITKCIMKLSITLYTRVH